MLKSLSREQRIMLIVLCLVNLVNYIDRQVIFPLFGSIKAEFHVSDFQLGLLGTMFMLVHSITSLPLGLLADRYNRKALIATGVTFWSGVTFFTGLVGNFQQLLGVRALVGIGEASYAPAATAMISDNFAAEVRARAQGFFNVGMFVGGTIGAMFGGMIAYYTHNWRVAFFVVALPGFILAWACSKLVDRRIQHEEDRVPVLSVLKNPAYLWILASGTLVTLAGGAYVSWGVEYVTRFKHFNLRDASLGLGLMIMLAGVVGVIAGSWLADHFQKRYLWGRSLVVGVSLILAAPFLYAGLGDIQNRWALAALFFTGTALLSFYHGPVAAVIHDIMPGHVRATAIAVYVLVIHLLGDTLAPAVIGAISDRSSLQTGLQSVTYLVPISGIFFLLVCREINKRTIKTSAA